jgi:predicted ATPase
VASVGARGLTPALDGLAAPCDDAARAGTERHDTMDAARIRTPDQRLRVFISSTLGELAEERRAARAAAEQLRVSPIMFELGARPHPPRALYRSYLEQSDVFVGIYWQRYGWVAPDMELSGLEDEYVLSQGMPRLIYVKRPADDIEPRLEELLGRVQQEDTASYKPFRDAAELHDLLLDDLALLLAERFDAVQQRSERRERAPSNLPVQITSFVGREEVLDQVRDLLRSDDVRLLTLTGPGGTGKTRLALEAAAGLVADFPDGVHFVDLSPEREPDGVFAAIVRTVALSGVQDDPPLEALARGLRDTRTLLLLDNFEQVTDAGPGVAELLQHCPQLRVLVTSRESLRVRPETLLAVPPLSLPEQGTVSAAEAKGADAIRLFVDRAGAFVPGFALTDRNAADIAAICQQLDGLPLAIELAAARVNLFALDDLRARLTATVDELRGGARDLPERQQTLRRAIEWSTGLLNDDERTAFALMSVFVGASLPDVEATAHDLAPLRSLDVVGCLGSLVDKNLVRSTLGPDGRPRLSMLQTVRSFAAEQLAARPDLATAAEHAHAEHYTALARDWQGTSGSRAREEVLGRLSAELGNLRAAWSYWVREGAIVQLDALLEVLWGYYDARGNYREAVELGHDLLGVLSRPPETPERIRDQIAMEASLARSMIAVRGYTAEVERSIRAALERSEGTADTPRRFPVLRSLATLHAMRTDFASGVAIGREMLAVAEERGDPELLSDAHLVLGVNTVCVDLHGSLRHFEQAVDNVDTAASSRLQFRIGPHPGVVARVVSGLLLWQVGFPDRGRLRAERSIEVADALGHPYSRAYARFHASLVALWQQDLTLVAERADELLRLAEDHDYPIWRALASIQRGTAWIGAGRPDHGLAEVEQGFALYRGLATPPVFWGGLLAIRATGCLLAGELDAAWRYTEQAAAAMWTGDPQEPELDIIRGDILLARPAPDGAAAEACFEHAAQVAADRGTRMSQLVAATRLATLRLGSARADDALASLCEVERTFTEGADLPQLAAARALLDTA